MNSFTTRKIGTLGRVVTGKTPSTANDDYFGGPYPFITIPDLDGRVIIDSSARTLSQAGAGAIKSSMLPAGSVMMSCIATVGKCGITARTSFTNQQINSVIPNEDVDAQFLYYAFREIGYVLERSGGGGSVYTNVSKSRFSEIELLVPPLPEQRAIAATLGALDDKIELNRKMNATLEATARALFRDWFVDFGPTRAKMEGRPPYLSPDIWALFPDRLDDEGKPEGWEVSPLGELGKVEWGNTSLTKSIYVEEGYPAFSAAGQDGFVTTPERKGLGVVISAIGTVGKIYLASGSWTAIKNTLTVQGETDAVSAFVYYLLQETALPTRGSTQQFISLGDAKAVKVISPNHQFILAFFDLVEPLIRKAIANANESRTLAQTRDLLVPRLMSGELRVADLDGQKAEHA